MHRINFLMFFNVLLSLTLCYICNFETKCDLYILEISEIANCPMIFLYTNFHYGYNSIDDYFKLSNLEKMLYYIKNICKANQGNNRCDIIGIMAHL